MRSRLLGALIVIAGCVSHVPVPPAAEPAAVSLDRMVREETDPRRAASMKSVEEGRQELAAMRFGRAAQHLSRAVEIDASNPFAYFYLALVRMRTARAEEALSLFRRAADLFAHLPAWRGEALAYRGEILESSGAQGRARRAFEEALRFDPANARAAEGLKRLP